MFFAGQINGVEGYMESAASGLAVAVHIASRLGILKTVDFPNYTMMGALAEYISDQTVKDFQPMGANFGVLPELPLLVRDKQKRYAEYFYRSAEWFFEKGFCEAVPKIFTE